MGSVRTAGIRRGADESILAFRICAPVLHLPMPLKLPLGPFRAVEAEAKDRGARQQGAVFDGRDPA